MVIEEDGKQLIIDPGVFTESLPELTNVCAIVITHVHADHFDLKQLGTIQAKNPDAIIYTVQEVADELGELKYEVVQASTSKQCGGFHVSFYGGEHAIIHDAMPVWQNVGILINDRFYYPGDSFAIPEDVSVHTLATPIIAPWSKISEVIDFVSTIKPKQTFPVHNAILSEIGDSVYNPRLQTAVEEVGGSFSFLKPGDSLTI